MKKIMTTKKMMDARVLKARVVERLMKSSYPNQMRLIEILATALDILVLDADKRLRGTFAAVGVMPDNVKSDNLRGLDQYCKAVKSATYWYERYVEPLHLINYEEEGMEGYDEIRVGANGWVQTIIMIADRIGSEEDLNKLIEVLNGLKPRSAFTAEDIDRFRMKGAK